MDSHAFSPNEAMYGPRFGAALAFTNDKHHGQRRKGSGAPYVTHPLAVASIVGQYGGDEDQAIAALLHDVMEDCGVAERELADLFGNRVARIVVACTDTVEQPKPPWRPRKEAHIAKVRSQDGDTKLVIAADKLHNATCIIRDARRRTVGQEVWSRFTAERDDVLWYYRAMTEALRAGWDHDLAHELHAVVAQMG